MASYRSDKIYLHRQVFYLEEDIFLFCTQKPLTSLPSGTLRLHFVNHFESGRHSRDYSNVEICSFSTLVFLNQFKIGSDFV